MEFIQVRKITDQKDLTETELDLWKKYLTTGGYETNNIFELDQEYSIDYLTIVTWRFKDYDLVKIAGVTDNFSHGLITFNCMVVALFDGCGKIHEHNIDSKVYVLREVRKKLRTIVNHPVTF